MVYHMLWYIIYNINKIYIIHYYPVGGFNPSEKCQLLVNWDDYPMHEMENKSHVPNHQPDYTIYICICPILKKCDFQWIYPLKMVIFHRIWPISAQPRCELFWSNIGPRCFGAAVTYFSDCTAFWISFSRSQYLSWLPMWPWQYHVTAMNSNPNHSEDLNSEFSSLDHENCYNCKSRQSPKMSQHVSTFFNSFAASFILPILQNLRFCVYLGSTGRLSQLVSLQF